jgi:hypothetical protein
MDRYGRIDAQLQADLDRLATKGIPVDVVFEQGPAVLGLADSTRNTPDATPGGGQASR